GAAIGTSKDALDTNVGRLEARAGDGGIWIENGSEASPRDLAIGGLSAVVGLSRSEIVLAHHGALRVEGNVGAGGDIKLRTVDAAGTGRDMTIVNGAGVFSLDADVTLLAGDNFTLEEQSALYAAGALTIVGDFGDADPGLGSVIDLRGAMIGSPIHVFGGAD